MECCVEPSKADCYELGFGDKLPYLTLRLGKTEDQIVLDHSFTDCNKGCEIENLYCSPPLTKAQFHQHVVVQLGTEMGKLNHWFDENREALFI